MVLAKDTLREIAERLPNEATYLDVMYELYVRMKIAKGKKRVSRDVLSLRLRCGDG